MSWPPLHRVFDMDPDVYAALQDILTVPRGGPIPAAPLVDITVRVVGHLTRADVAAARMDAPATIDLEVMGERPPWHILKTPSALVTALLPVDRDTDPTAELLAASKALRAAQRAYMSDRGNDSLGAEVGRAAARLDVAIAGAE